MQMQLFCLQFHDSFIVWVALKCVVMFRGFRCFMFSLYVYCSQKLRDRFRYKLYKVPVRSNIHTAWSFISLGPLRQLKRYVIVMLFLSQQICIYFTHPTCSFFFLYIQCDHAYTVCLASLFLSIFSSIFYITAPFLSKLVLKFFHQILPPKCHTNPPSKNLISWTFFALLHSLLS